ncbi:MAG: endolytic transglycosylase MltG [Treponema sp.]|nr:endolytic transglycosylase MltG [Treponema sp.]
MKKKVKIFLLILILIVSLLCAVFFYLRSQFLPVQSDTSADYVEDVRFEIPYGTSLYTVSEELKAAGLIKNDRLFYYAARYPQILKVFFPREAAGMNFSLKSGIYHLTPSFSVIEIMNFLSSGQTEFCKVSIPEGLTISKIAAILEEQRICNKGDFISACRNPENFMDYPFYELFENGKIENCEGFLFPDTYYLNIGMNAESVLAVMVENFFEKIKEVPNLSEMTTEELFETVTLASIVEREYRVDEEAPLIASVFKNRLERNIGLYSCATLEYIITEIQGKPHPDTILISDTKIDNPYNTYKWAGLTPGPISNPGLVALNAATNTPKTNYYFFQVINPAEGRHVFTTTLEEHNVNKLYTKKAAGK